MSSHFFGQLGTKWSHQWKGWIKATKYHTGFASVLCPSSKSPWCSKVAQSKIVLMCSCWTQIAWILNIMESINEKLQDYFSKTEKKKSKQLLIFRSWCWVLRILNVKTLTSRKMEIALLTVQPSDSMRF